MADTSDSSDTCVVCFKTVEYYSIGQCDHPVCYECSTRMRVLCLQNECPICRQMLSRVVFTETPQPYETLRNRPFSEKLFERQFKIAFCSEEIKNAYEEILEHRCKLCPKMQPFRTFEMLSDHMRKVHERFYCDLCVKHLKIFSSERKFYTRQELAHHRRKGDLDDTSHRGHPLCQFCEVRFMDNDELYRHLRKEHLYCHLCDADGRNQYYPSHAELAHHFRRDHFLCEEGDCAGDHLTSVFRTEIDLKAHKAQVHGRGMSRGATRQARTLELQFNITPHQFASRQQRNEGVSLRETERSVVAEPVLAPAPAARAIDTGSVEQFPRLSTAPPAPAPLTSISRHYQGSGGLAKTKENFPTLDGGPPRSAQPLTTTPRGLPAAAVLKTNGKSSMSVPLQSQAGGASNFRLTTAAGSQPAAARRAAFHDDFPSLSVPDDDRPSLGAATLQPPKVALVSSEQIQALKQTPAKSAPPRQRLDAEAFPALAPASGPAAPPQWITVSKPKEKQKPSKVAPAPTLPVPAVFNPVADFPQLTNNNKNKKKQPQAQTSTPTESEVKSKKDKKKQNGKVLALEDTTAMFNGVSLNKDNQTAWDGKKMGKENKSAGEPVPVETSNGNVGVSMSADNFPALSRRTKSGLTFINSSGETFSAPLHSYVPPPEFEKRNVELVKNFIKAIGPNSMEGFRNVSLAFRAGGVSADEFYKACRRSLGARFEELFPEVVALLPDIGKQQALVAGRGEVGLDMCAACGQLLAARDVPAHRAVHWPALSR